MTRKAKPKECSARVVDGRMVCDCLTGKPEIQADLSVCYPKMQELMTEVAAHVAAKLRAGRVAK